MNDFDGILWPRPARGFTPAASATDLAVAVAFLAGVMADAAGHDRDFEADLAFILGEMAAARGVPNG